MAPTNITWQDCQIFTEVFSKVDDHAIQCDIILPPTLQPGKHPLLIAYHGGYLVSGARDFYMFMGSWLPSYAASSSAIVVSPDYRLLPSANAGHVRDDVEALWSWVHSTLPSVLAAKCPDHHIDLTRIVVEGHSAGGFCAAHLAMNHPEQIKAALLTYPMLHNTSPYLIDGPPTLPAEMRGIPLLTGSDLESTIEAEKQKGWVSTRRDMAGIALTLSIVKGGHFGRFFGDKKHDPIVRVRNEDGKGLPPKVWILHGKDDTGVPVQGSLDFVEAVKKSSWKTELRLDVVDEEPSEHGFDKDWDLGKKRLADALNWVNESW